MRVEDVETVEGHRVVTVSTGDLRAVVRLRETQPDSGWWEAVGVEVLAESGHLTANVLRDFPYANTLRVAKQAVRAVKGKRLKVLSEVLMPSAFLEDRRGRGPRSDADFAGLANVYVSLATYGPDGYGDDPFGKRHALSVPQAAARLAERHSGTPKTWDNRIREAQARGMWALDREQPVLTDQGIELVYGSPAEAFFGREERDDSQQERDERDERWSSGEFTEAERRKFQLAGKSLASAIEDAQRRLGRGRK